MITAELVKPERLNQYGQLWERGKPMRVSVEMAEKLAVNPRFLVKGLNPARDRELDIRKPKGAALFQAILSGFDKLDPDDPSCFTRDGDPNWRALTEVLGYTVTADDYARALKYQRGDEVAEATANDLLPSNLPDPNRGDLTSADVRNPPTRRNVRIVRRTKSDSNRIKDEAARRIATAKTANPAKVVTAPGEAPLTAAQAQEQEETHRKRQQESLQELREDPELAHLADADEDATDDAPEAEEAEEEAHEV